MASLAKLYTLDYSVSIWSTANFKCRMQRSARTLLSVGTVLNVQKIGQEPEEAPSVAIWNGVATGRHCHLVCTLLFVLTGTSISTLAIKRPIPFLHSHGNGGSGK